MFEADGLTPASTESITCEGTTPSNGINCNSARSGVDDRRLLRRGFDRSDGSYCKHLPTNAAGKTIDKPGTVAIPKAKV